MATSRKRTYGRGFITRQRRHGVEYGCYLMRYYVGGKERVESTKTLDRAEAILLLNQRLGAVATGQAPAPGRVTVADLLDDYVSLQEIEQRPSLRTTRTHVITLKAAFGTLRAADVTPKHLQRFVTAQRKPGAKTPGRRYAEQTIALQLATLKAAFNLARKANKLTTLPDFPSLDVSGNVRQGYATVAQANVIFATLATRDADLTDAVEWKFWTGMRKGAVSRLGWDLWDLETEMLRLPPGGRRKRTPKAIPLKPGHPLRAIIDRRWQRRKERARETGKLEPLIFWRVYQGSPKAPTNGRPALRQGDAVPVYEYRKAWKTAVVAAGCPNLTVHDLRRTAIRNSWHATGDRRTGMLLSGHVTESTFERYNIDSGEQLVGHLDQIAAYVAKQPQDAPADVPTLPRVRARRR